MDDRGNNIAVLMKNFTCFHCYFFNGDLPFSRFCFSVKRVWGAFCIVSRETSKPLIDQSGMFHVKHCATRDVVIVCDGL